MTDTAVSPSLRVWHFCYCRWYDADRAGHRRRAAAWGWLANRAVRVGDVIGWGA